MSSCMYTIYISNNVYNNNNNKKRRSVASTRVITVKCLQTAEALNGLCVSAWCGETGQMMSLGNISREALAGSVTLGAVFVAGYFLGKSESVQILLH